MKVYKIRHTPTGKFVSTVFGAQVTFSNMGRIFHSLSALKSHVASMWHKREDVYKDCEVVVFECTETAKKTVKDFTISAE
jgi:hypothetical protein